jgi:hypothetical protein
MVLLLQELKEVNQQILNEQAKGQIIEEQFEALAQTVSTLQQIMKLYYFMKVIQIRNSVLPNVPVILTELRLDLFL